MGAFSIAEAKAQLSAIVEKVEHGEAITITKRGKPVVKIVPVSTPPAKPKIDLARLEALHASLPRFPVTGVEILRQMRAGEIVE